MLLDVVVYLGSSNLDVRSLLINCELPLRLPSAALAARLRAEFEIDRRSRSRSPVGPIVQ